MKKGIDFIGVGTGAIIFNEEGKVFLARRGPKARNESGKWDFPGGSVEFGEPCEEAIKREIKEEYDFDIEVLELLEVVNHIIPEEKQHWVSPSFIAKKISGTPKNLEPEKCTEIKWADLSEINPDELTMPSRSNFLKFREKYGLKLPEHLK
jgi:8-oxo-dGTP diphosphatase